MSARSPILLVHGAWFRSWVWRSLRQSLEAAGHRVITPDLLCPADLNNGQAPVSLINHVDQVVSCVEMFDLENLTMVGWSYGGMVVSEAASRLTENVSQLIFLDAFLPEAGKALADYLPVDAQRELSILKRLKRDIPIPDIHQRWNIEKTTSSEQWQQRLQTQPINTFLEAATSSLEDLDRLHRCYVRAKNNPEDIFTPFADKLKVDDRWDVIETPTSHLLPLTDSKLLSKIIKQKLSLVN